MKKIFLDTNILLDVFLERQPFCIPAQKIWTLAERKEIEAAISVISINNSFFIIKKLTSAGKAYEAIEVLTKIFKLIELNSPMIHKALKTNNSDFEDTLQYLAAKKFRANAIISRNLTGFKKSEIPILDSSQYLAQINFS